MASIPICQKLKLYLFISVLSQNTVLTFSELTNGCSAFPDLVVGNCLFLRGTGMSEGGAVNVVLLRKGI